MVEVEAFGNAKAAGVHGVYQADVECVGADVNSTAATMGRDTSAGSTGVIAPLASAPTASDGAAVVGTGVLVVAAIDGVIRDTTIVEDAHAFTEDADISEVDSTAAEISIAAGNGATASADVEATEVAAAALSVATGTGAYADVGKASRDTTNAAVDSTFVGAVEGVSSRMFDYASAEVAAGYATAANTIVPTRPRNLIVSVTSTHDDAANNNTRPYDTAGAFIAANGRDQTSVAADCAVLVEADGVTGVGGNTSTNHTTLPVSATNVGTAAAAIEAAVADVDATEKASAPVAPIVNASVVASIHVGTGVVGCVQGITPCVDAVGDKVVGAGTSAGAPAAEDTTGGEENLGNEEDDYVSDSGNEDAAANSDATEYTSESKEDNTPDSGDDTIFVFCEEGCCNFYSLDDIDDDMTNIDNEFDTNMEDDIEEAPDTREYLYAWNITVDHTDRLGQWAATNNRNGLVVVNMSQLSANLKCQQQKQSTRKNPKRQTRSSTSNKNDQVS